MGAGGDRAPGLKPRSAPPASSPVPDEPGIAGWAETRYLDFDLELTLTARLRDGRSITVIANDLNDADERLACAVARELRVAGHV